VALNPVNPIESASATATNGSPTISVTGNVDCSFIVPGFVLQLGTRRIVAAISGTAPVSGTSTITLAANWDQATTTDKLIGWNSYESLPNIVNRIQNALANQTAIGELSSTGLIERTGPNAFSTVPVTTYGKSLINAADAPTARGLLGVAAASVSVANLKALPAAASAQVNTVYSVIALSSGGTVGGGHFVWGSSVNKTTHDGSSVVAPEAITAWDGTAGNLSQLTGWTGTGTGCWVLLGSMMSPAPISMEGRVNLSELPETNFYITNNVSITDLPPGWPQGRYYVQQFGRPLDSYCMQVITDINASGANGGTVCRQAVRRMRTAGVWSDWFEILNTNSALYKELTPNVANIAALRARAGAFDNQRVFVSEYSTGTDSGGGSAVWNSTSTAADNGVTVFAVTGVATGRWLRQYEQLTVDMAGAVPGVSDTAAIQRAVDVALALGADLYWPDGTYLKSASVANFWSVKHTGPGKLQTGASGPIINITPSGSQTNTIYYSATGNDTNDGMTTAAPRATLSNARDLIEKLWEDGKLAGGKLVIDLAAGTWTDQGFRINKRVMPAQPILINGKVDGANAPTVIVSSASGSARALLKCLPGGYFDVYGVRFNGRATDEGIVLDGEGEINTDRCYVNGVATGYFVAGRARMRTRTSVAEACVEGYTASYSSQFSFGDDTPDTACSAINCDRAVFVTRNAVGHVDHMAITDCDEGVIVDMAARVNVLGSNFKRCAMGVKTYGAATWVNGNTTYPNTFNMGTVDACAVMYEHTDCSGEERMYRQQAFAERRLGFEYKFDAPFNLTGTTTTNTLIVGCKYANGGLILVPGYFFKDPGKKLRVVIYGQKIGTAGNKTVSLLAADYATGSNGATMASASIGSTAGRFCVEFEIFAKDLTNQFQTLREELDGVAQEISYNPRTVSFAADRQLRICGTLVNAADTLSIDAYEVYQIG